AKPPVVADKSDALRAPIFNVDPMLVPLRPVAPHETMPPRPDKSTMQMPELVKAGLVPPAATPLAAAPPPDSIPAAAPASVAPPPVDDAIDPALEAARSGPARRGLGTKRA